MVVEIHALGGLKGVKQVLGITARRDGDQDVARFTEGDDLPDEHVGETDIVGDRRNHRHVVIQADRGQVPFARP